MLEHYYDYDDHYPAQYYHKEEFTSTTTTRALHMPYGPPDPNVTPWEISSLSDTQEKIISVLPVLSGLLSVLGSCTILYMIFHRKTASKNNDNKQGGGGGGGRQQQTPLLSPSSFSSWLDTTTPYTRLLFGMSCCDIVGSISQMLMPFLLPQATSQRVWAFGNDATCTAIGFFQQLTLSAFLYNAMLSFYFVLTARFGWKHVRFSKLVEPCMHIISVGYPLVTATYGAILGIYHEMEIGQTCWITNYPEGCEELEDVPCQSITLGWIFGGTILLFAFLSIPINNMIIFLFVRKQTTTTRRKRKKTRRRDERKATNRSIGGTGTTATTTTITSPRSRRRQRLRARLKLTRKRRGSSSSSFSKSRTKSIDSIMLWSNNNNNNNNNNSIENGSSSNISVAPPPPPPLLPDSLSTTSEDEENLQLESRQQQRLVLEAEEDGREEQKLEEYDDDDDDHDAAATSIRLIQDEQQQQQLQLQRLQLIASQAFLYVAAFFLCTIWSFLLRIMESISYNAEDEDALFPLLVLQAWFLPLQGFFNVFVYVRPKYIKHRRRYPDESKWWALRRSIFGEHHVPPSRCSAGGVTNNNNNNNQNNNNSNKQPPPQQKAQQKCYPPKHHVTWGGKKELLEPQYQQQQPVRDHEVFFNNDGALVDKDKKEQTMLLSQSMLPHNNIQYNNNVSSITCDEDLLIKNGNDHEDDDQIVQVPVKSEWRWTSGMHTNRRSKNSSGGGGTSSLEAISELSAVSFVDPEDDDYEKDAYDYDDKSAERFADSSSASSSSGNDTLPDEDDDYLDVEVVTIKSAPVRRTADDEKCLVQYTSRGHTSAGDTNDPPPQFLSTPERRRRWSDGNASSDGGVVFSAMDKLQLLQSPAASGQALTLFIRSMFGSTSSSTNDNTNEANEDAASLPSSDDGGGSGGGSLDPSFDRMGSSTIQTASTSRDTPAKRPTRRLSPTDLEISATSVTKVF